MSIFSAITKRSKLNALIKQSTEARRSEELKAKQLFKDACSGFAEVVMDDPLRAEALYNWGLALLHYAKMQTGDEAIKLYQDSFTKFSFCLLLDPNYLAAAIDSGVACMDLARIQGVSYHHELYENARKQFEKANSIQAGAASYNLACIYGLRGSKDACLKALENSRDKGLLPDADEILNDPDLSSVVAEDWFVGFMGTLKKKPEAVETTEIQAETQTQKMPEANEAQAENTVTAETQKAPDPTTEDVSATADEQSSDLGSDDITTPLPQPEEMHTSEESATAQEQSAETETQAEEEQITSESTEQEADESSATERRRDYFLKL